jgi:hypothetical protein
LRPIDCTISETVYSLETLGSAAAAAEADAAADGEAEAEAAGAAVPQPLSRMLADRSSDVRNGKNDRAVRLFIEKSPVPVSRLHCLAV